MLRVPFLLLLSSVVFVPEFAFADSEVLFDWSYSGSGVTASGQLIADPTGLPFGEYLVTSLTGIRNGNAITGFFADTCIDGPGCISSFPADGSTVDNLLYYPASGGFAAGHTGQINTGLIFTTIDGSFNVYYDGGFFGSEAVGDYEYAIGSSNIPGTFINSFVAIPDQNQNQATAVPEPATWEMLAAATLVCGYLFGRRSRQHSAE